MTFFRLLRALAVRLCHISRRAEGERDFEDELRSNIQLHIDDNLRAGMPLQEARRQALLRFGGLETTREAWRDRQRIPLLDTATRNTKYAARILRKNPGFGLAVILVLGIAIGGNLAIFTIVNAVLIRPLPYKNPDRLVLLWGNVERKVIERRGASIPDYFDWKNSNKSFEGLAAYWNATFAFTPSTEPLLIPGEVVGANYFALLGASPLIGRDFLPEEEGNPGVAPTVILAHKFWQEYFAGNADVIGTSLKLDSRLYTIVGVMPSDVLGLTGNASLFVPMAALPDPQKVFADRGSRWFAVLAKMREGISRQGAQAEMDSISKNLQKAYAGTNGNRAVEVASLRDETVGTVRPALIALLGAVGMLLLIACANVANLLLARAETRHSELAVRSALGAGKRDVLQLLMTESLILSAFGTILGMFIAVWGVKLILAISPIQLPAFVTLGVDPSVIAFAAALAIITGTCMGVMSSIQIGNLNIGEALKGGAGRVTGLPGRQRFRDALIVIEVALTVVLLVGAGLFIQSFRQITQTDPGFQTDRLLTAQITAAGDERVNRQVVRNALAAIPSVQAVTLASDVPFIDGSATFYTAEGQAPIDSTSVPRAYVHRVMPGYFEAMGIHMRNGREFRDDEPNKSVIVSEAVARRFWPGQDPIGRRIKRGNTASDSPWLNVVGVVVETKTRGLPTNPTADPDLYFPYTSDPGSAAIVIRTKTDPATVAGEMREAIHRINKSTIVSNVTTMDTLMRGLTARSRFTSWLTGIFSAVALVLALVGIYGTMSYNVTQRTKEIGIRIALGATSRGVLTSVFRAGLVPIAIGLAGGIAASVLISRAIVGLLFGISSAGPNVFLLVALLVLTTGSAAVLVPARRALHVDPMRTLRQE